MILYTRLFFLHCMCTVGWEIKFSFALFHAKKSVKAISWYFLTSFLFFFSFLFLFFFFFCLEGEGRLALKYYWYMILYISSCFPEYWWANWSSKTWNFFAFGITIAWLSVCKYDFSIASPNSVGVHRIIINNSTFHI